jgi:hypothetical protein
MNQISELTAATPFRSISPDAKMATRDVSAQTHRPRVEREPPGSFMITKDRRSVAPAILRDHEMTKDRRLREAADTAALSEVAPVWLRHARRIRVGCGPLYRLDRAHRTPAT